MRRIVCALTLWAMLFWIPWYNARLEAAEPAPVAIEAIVNQQ